MTSLDNDNRLIPDAQVCKRYGVCAMTLMAVGPRRQPQFSEANLHSETKVSPRPRANAFDEARASQTKEVA